MDMEHQLLLFSPQEHFMASPPGFFAVGAGYSAHFQTGEFVEPVGVVATGIEDGAWVEDLMQLGDELFGGGDVAAVAGTGDHEPWWYEDDGGGGSGSTDGPPASVSPGGYGSPPPSGEQGAEPHREDGGDDASPVTRKRRDRSKTMVSERKRRVRMKEKLYELRSLVPNITKMDKASIIADAVVYVKNLQAHARKLREEVAALEVRPRSPSPAGPGHEQHGGRTAAAAAAGRRHHRPAAAGHGARLSHVGVVQVGDGRFFVTVECERRDGVAAPLCAAAESLACFRVESSSLARSGPDRVVSTLTLKVSERVGDTTIGENSVKLWVMAALLKEGFRPEPTVEISLRSTCQPIN
ncbi:hypothetical protein SEVIR_7G076400v4 [Setaria viridis]|uniref:BHLH domain-containing protein n=1 Tax=Setaria viridis TaxID=4556 RepID=A0A4U6TT63_SETVI|nr:transcription factor BHLH156-like [Setaria viridis]TKW03939.1 hypothetical protein SEVIR_7G076400v2 [Setaria viridis]